MNFGEFDMQYEVNSDAGYQAAWQFFEQARADALDQPIGAAVTVEEMSNHKMWRRKWNRSDRAYRLQPL